MPDRMPDRMSDKNVMVGITRSKVIVFSCRISSYTWKILFFAEFYPYGWKNATTPRSLVLRGAVQVANKYNHAFKSYKLGYTMIYRYTPITLVLIQEFPQIEVSKNGWFIRETPNLKWMKTGGTPISGNLHPPGTGSAHSKPTRSVPSRVARCGLCPPAKRGIKKAGEPKIHGIE